MPLHRRTCPRGDLDLFLVIVDPGLIGAASWVRRLLTGTMEAVNVECRVVSRERGESHLHGRANLPVVGLSVFGKDQLGVGVDGHALLHIVEGPSQAWHSRRCLLAAVEYCQEGKDGSNEDE